jgi:hypothetical protein
MVNRHVQSINDIVPDYWPGYVYAQIGNHPACGVAIEAEAFENNVLNMVVHVGFTQTMSGQYNIHALLVQDRVTSADSLYDQMNDFSSEGATPDSNLTLYNLNDTIHNYAHHFVLRKVLSQHGPDGDPIPLFSTFANNQYVTSISANLTGFDASQCYVLVCTRR